MAWWSKLNDLVIKADLVYHFLDLNSNKIDTWVKGLIMDFVWTVISILSNWNIKENYIRAYRKVANLIINWEINRVVSRVKETLWNRDPNTVFSEENWELFVEAFNT